VLQHFYFCCNLFSDYLTANGPNIKTPLNDTQKAALYAELASGAETGMHVQRHVHANGFVQFT
jgi:hypothetical protein